MSTISELTIPWRANHWPMSDRHRTLVLRDLAKIEMAHWAYLLLRDRELLDTIQWKLGSARDSASIQREDWYCWSDRNQPFFDSWLLGCFDIYSESLSLLVASFACDWYFLAESWWAERSAPWWEWSMQWYWVPTRLIQPHSIFRCGWVATIPWLELWGNRTSHFHPKQLLHLPLHPLPLSLRPQNHLRELRSKRICLIDEKDRLQTPMKWNEDVSIHVSSESKDWTR